MDRNDARQNPVSVSVIDRSAQHAELAAHGSRRTATKLRVGAARLARNVLHSPTLPIGHKTFDGSSHAPRRGSFLPMLLSVVSQDIRQEDLSGVTRPCCSCSCVDEFAEGDFSELAIWSARAALP